MTPLAYVMLGIFGGILVTAPLGPVNVMIIQRSLRDGFASGVCAGFGAAIADILFATGAAFGVSTVDAFIEGHSRSIQLLGGTLVLLMGLRIVWTHASTGFVLPINGGRSSVGMRSLGTTFALTITNPATIFGFMGYFSALGAWGPQQEEFWGTVQLILGVAIGTLGWWCGLAAVVTRLRTRFNEQLLAKFNIVAGMLLIGIGGGILGRLSATYFKLL